MTFIRQILEEKGRSVWSIAPRATVFEAIKLMADKQIGAVLVMENGDPVGILSERDYARKVILHDRASRETLVEEIMTPKPFFVRAEQTVEEAMALMTTKRIRHLPVQEGGKVAGMISIGDLVKATINNQQFEIEQLHSYISR